MEKEWWKLEEWMFAGSCEARWIECHGLGWDLGKYEDRSSFIFVEKRLNGEWYNKILENGLLPLYSGKLSKSNTLFQEYGAPCHTCRVSKAWKAEHGIESLEWVAQSPHLNPIEHVWEYLDRKIRARRSKAWNIDDLKRILSEEWETMDETEIQKLMQSVPTRVEAVKCAEGGSTKYQ